MKNSLRWQLATITLIVSLFLAPSSKATHLMGADLTYECLGGNTYRVTLSLYRDCIGIAAPSSANISITSSCAPSSVLVVYPRPGTGQEVTPSCSTSVTTCRGGTFTGIQEWIYDGIVTLPTQCANWTFSYNPCCRNAAITNITNPGSSTFYIYATLNNLITPCNNSPTFSNKPVPFLCRGQNYCFNHGVYDADGDSITFQLITPKQTATTNVNYLAPFNASNPLTSNPATSFNATTGDICMTPTNMEVTVMAVLVKEYRNGVLIGSVERDLQLTVMMCANNLPSLSGINGTNDFSITVCANQPACFNIFSDDPDAGQNLTVTWDQGIPGATFTTTSAQHPTATFCWTPTTAEIGNSYFFTAMVSDDACPYIGSQVYSYTINVVGVRVDLGPDQSIACSDQTTLSANASGGNPPYQYAWSNGSSMQQVTVGAGTWMVSATDGVCSASDTISVDMPFIPNASFLNGIGSCANEPVQFTDSSTTPGGLIYNWLWNFGDGTISLDQHPQHQFPGPGTYSVSLVVENTFGCSDTIVRSLTIDPQPVAAFTAGNGCVNAPIQFNNQNGSSASGWIWNFGDGFTTTAVSPLHGFSSPGNYNVTLIGTSAGGCSDTATMNIQIFPNPTANAGADRTTCRGTSVTLTASGGNNYTWSPGGNGQSITVNPLGTTNYVVAVTNPNGCSATDTVTVIVNPVPVINAGNDVSICRGSAVTLTGAGGSTYVWNPGNLAGSSITVSPNNSTNYTVTGTNIYGCTSTDVVNVNVNQLPNANAGADIDICRGGTATLTASGGNTYDWILTGGTTSTITVNPIGTTNYTVVVTDANGCTDADIVEVTVHDNPSVNLQSFFLCTGAVATLDAGISGLSYTWSPSGATTQTITINNAGIYGVTVTDAFGCSASATATVTTGSSLSVNLNDVSFCQGDSVILDPGYPGMSYLWTPGGQTSQTITVSAPGIYGVTVTDPSGCSGSVNVNAQMNTLPIPIFNSTSVCMGAPTQFTDASSVAGSSITNWSWNFGNNSVSAQQNPAFTFSNAGNYNVSLTVTSADGCSASTSANVTVNPLPSASFNVQDICAGASAIFTNQSSVSRGNITGYSWDFGDGTTSNDNNPSHIYNVAGNYMIRLDIVTAGGCTGTVTRQINVFPNPNVTVSSNTVCEGRTTAFNNSSTITNGNISSYNWNFGDGFTSSQTNPSHTYSVAGTFTATVIATSNRGCKDTATINVNVRPLPQADAGSDRNICPGSTVTLTASGGNSYSWSPGNSTTASINVTPNSNSNYSVTVTDNFGCSGTDNVSVNILPLPNAVVSSDASICNGDSVNLTASGAPMITWSPGGMSGSSIIVSPSITTDYTVTVTDGNGCMDSETVTVTVNNLPNVNAGPDRTVCSGSAVALQASGANSYSWTPGGSSSPTLIFTPTVSGSYVVTGFTSQGCSATDVVNVTVNQAPVLNLLPSFVCQGYTTTLDAGNPGSDYQWSTGETTQTILVNDSGSYSVTVVAQNGCVTNGAATVSLGGTMQALPSNSAVCSGQYAVLDAGNPGSTYVWSNGSTTQTISVNTPGNYLVTITDINGCSAATMHQVTVNNIPTASFTATTACLGNSINFTNQSSVGGGQIQNVSWDFGNGIASSLLNPVQNYAVPGAYPVTLTVTTNAGCSASVTNSVTVNPLPLADFNATTVCLGDATTFNDASTIPTGNITSWNWNFGDNTNSNTSSPSHS
ncbi:MAG: PKD domain-containing protein, partial [Bacteroidota bacterium]